MNTPVESIRNEYIDFVRLEKNYAASTVQEYEKDLTQFLQFLSVEGITALEAVTYQDARLYVTSLYDEGYSRTTISRKISSIRSFFKFAHDRYRIDDSAFRSLHHPKKEGKLPSFFYEEELQELFTKNEGDDPKSIRDSALLELLYATGIRVGELTTITLNAIDDYLGVVLVMGKGRKERYVPYGSYAQAALDRYMEHSRPMLMRNKKHNMLFVNLRGDPLTERGVRHILTKMVENASLHTKMHPHRIRHSFATHLLSNGADMRTVQELLGHQHLSSTQIYTHITKEHLRNTYMNTHPRA